MGISALGAVNSVNTKHSMPLSGKGPDWSIIPSSGKSSKSKAEFTDEIKELARKAANTTSKAELEYIHRRRTELCAEYMSDVSPDRKALYRQAENALKGVVRQIICTYILHIKCACISDGMDKHSKFLHLFAQLI